MVRTKLKNEVVYCTHVTKQVFGPLANLIKIRSSISSPVFDATYWKLGAEGSSNFNYRTSRLALLFSFFFGPLHAKIWMFVLQFFEFFFLLPLILYCCWEELGVEGGQSYFTLKLMPRLLYTVQLYNIEYIYICLL